MKKYILFIVIFIVASLLSSAQKNLEGKVFDGDSDKGLPGANIYWAGTNSGTSTNSAGYFVLKKERKSNHLIISFVGYRTDTIEVEKSLEYFEHKLQPVAEIGEIIIFGRRAGTHVDRIDPLLTYKITGAELTKAACCNLSESFTTNASVDVSFSDALTGAKQIRLLGLEGTYVQIMTENFPSLYGLGSAFGLNYIPGPWMESIQVSKGTASVRNGYEAITGQINVEFKKPGDSELLYFNLYGNSAGKIESNFNGSLRINDRLSTALFAHSETDRVANDHNGDGFRDEPNLNQYHFFNRWDYLSDRLSIRGGIRIMKEERIGGQIDYKPEIINGLYGIMINTSRAEAFSKTGFIFPADKSMSLGWINNLTYHKQDAIYGLNSYSGLQRSWYSNLLYQWKPLLNEHTLDAGLSYKYDDYTEVLNSNNMLRTEKVPGVFLQYSYVDTSRITVVAGLRADFHNLYGTFLTPRLHLRYKPLDRLVIRATAGKGYRSTNVLAENQYLLASSRLIDTGSELNLEEAVNAGISITRYIPLKTSELRLTADYYHTGFINQIVTDLDSYTDRVLFYNLDGRSYSNIIQLEAQWEPAARLEMLLAIRYNDVKMTTGGELRQKALTSKYKGLMTLSYLSYLRKWQYDFTLHLNGPGRVPSTSSNPPEYRVPDNFNAFALINAQVARKFKKMDLYLGVENIGNYRQKNPVISADNPFSDYFDAGLIWGPVTGRMIYGGIRITIN
ncbi:MAG: TonB-dependent receptor [Marinilabiliaceae bacterium]|jgi:outer membrane cobalamin receptor|nr:TonB-dependent receptor [Marinilabiliaceae bacterium]